MRKTPHPATSAEPATTLPTWLHLSDVQGLAQLATQGVLGVAGLAETVQGQIYKRVAAPLGLLGARFVDTAPGASGVRANGITGLVYGGVRAAARLAGGTVNAAFSAAAPLARQRASSSQREAFLSAVNGVLGDHLLASANPLAITMTLRHRGIPLVLEPAALAGRLPQAGGKLLVLIHGLCMNDLQWEPSGAPSHAQLLATALGYTPVYLHYNTGLHTSVNGRQLALMLEQLVRAWPEPVQELSVVAHSMGGLVARSACEHAETAGHAWRERLTGLAFLGTPHHGAPLERLGHWIDTVLDSHAASRPFAAIGQIRSAGITDLRYGNVREADWQQADRFQGMQDARVALPLPAGVRCYAVAGSTRSDVSGDSPGKAQALHQQIIGDGLVPLASALGQHEDPARTLAFAPENQWIAADTGHIALLHRTEVGAQLVHWLGGRN